MYTVSCKMALLLIRHVMKIIYLFCEFIIRFNFYFIYITIIYLRVECIEKQ